MTSYFTSSCSSWTSSISGSTCSTFYDTIYSFAGDLAIGAFLMALDLVATLRDEAAFFVLFCEKGSTFYEKAICCWLRRARAMSWDCS
jgi:hypothetical protein